MQKPRLSGIIDRSLNYGRHQVENFFSAIQRENYKIVLDIGAGHGDDLFIARKYNKNAELHGVEVYPPYAEELKQAGVTVHALNIETDRLPFADEAINVIIANQILEHVKEIFSLLHEISRTLKIGGSLIIGVPNLASLHNRLLLLFGQQPSTIQNNSAHVRGYTKKDLIKSVKLMFSGRLSDAVVRRK